MPKREARRRDDLAHSVPSLEGELPKLALRAPDSQFQAQREVVAVKETCASILDVIDPRHVTNSLPTIKRTEDTSDI